MSKKQNEEFEIIDCMGQPYIPALIELARLYGNKIKQAGRSGEEREKGKVLPPRLYHRRKGFKYVSDERDENGNYVAWTTGKQNEGLVSHPRFVNPHRGHEAGLRLLIQCLFEHFQPGQLDGIVGRFNGECIQEYRGLEKHLQTCRCKPEDCPSPEKRSEGCRCVWLPGQLLTWGRLSENDEFQPLPEDEVFITEWVPIEQLKDEVHALMAPDAPRAEKLGNNARNSQRTDFNTRNPYGLPLHQFGMAIETSYDAEGSLLVALAVNRRDPACMGSAPRRPRKKKSQPVLSPVQEPDPAHETHDVWDEVDVFEDEPSGLAYAETVLGDDEGCFSDREERAFFDDEED